MYDCKGQRAASKVWLCSRYGGGVKQKGETTAEFEHDAAEKGNTRGKIRGRRRHSIQPMVAKIGAIGIGLGSPSPLFHPFSANLLDVSLHKTIFRTINLESTSKGRVSYTTRGLDHTHCKEVRNTSNQCSPRSLSGCWLEPCGCALRRRITATSADRPCIVDSKVLFVVYPSVGW